MRWWNLRLSWINLENFEQRMGGTIQQSQCPLGREAQHIDNRSNHVWGYGYELGSRILKFCLYGILFNYRIELWRPRFPKASQQQRSLWPSSPTSKLSERYDVISYQVRLQGSCDSWAPRGYVYILVLVTLVTLLRRTSIMLQCHNQSITTMLTLLRKDTHTKSDAHTIMIVTGITGTASPRRTL